jgi:hypothetical protein
MGLNLFSSGYAGARNIPLRICYDMYEFFPSSFVVEIAIRVLSILT